MATPSVISLKTLWAIISADPQRARRLATYASLATAVTLILAKSGAWLATDSMVLLSSLLDSTMDLLASGVAAYGVAHALRPPDRQHRFGHGKAEPLAALAQAAFIVGSAAVLGYEALGRFLHPQHIHAPLIGYAVSLLAIVLTIALVSFQNVVVRRTGSVAIGADRLHYTGDVMMNGAVIVGLALQQVTGALWFDPLFALGIAGFLTWNALHIARSSLGMLMDQELPETDRAGILAVAKAHESVRGVHDLRTRTDGSRWFIDMHLELPPDMPLRVAHEVAEDVITRLARVYPQADVMIHEDPSGIEEPQLDREIEARAAEKRHG